MRIAPLLALAGCPYLFEPPDLSNVDGKGPADGDADTDADTDADADADADTDADTDVGTGETGDTGGIVLPKLEPLVTSFEVTPRLGGKVFHFAVSDAEENLEGGRVELTNGKDVIALQIPGEVDDWQPGATSTETLALPGWIDCYTTVDEDWTITVIDRDGNTSQPVPFHLHVEALGFLKETGGAFPDGSHLVTAAPPYVGCVQYEVDDPKATNYDFWLKREVEGVILTPAETRNHVVEVDSAAAIDIDVVVYYYPTFDKDGTPGADNFAEGRTVGDTPESVPFPGTAGDDVLADLWFQRTVSGYPPFEATFLVTPE